MPKTKPRLNLDIFSEEETVHVPAFTAPDTIEIPETKAEKHDIPITNKKSPRFVPVGFYPEHLHLLDEAVLNLRRQGHWQVSKSGIIRRLIENNKDRLEEVWLKTA